MKIETKAMLGFFAVLVLNFSLLGFAVWVVIKVMQHFGIIG